MPCTGTRRPRRAFEMLRRYSRNNHHRLVDVALAVLADPTSHPRPDPSPPLKTMQQHRCADQRRQAGIPRPRQEGHSKQHLPCTFGAGSTSPFRQAPSSMTTRVSPRWPAARPCGVDAQSSGANPAPGAASSFRQSSAQRGRRRTLEEADPTTGLTERGAETVGDGLLHHVRTACAVELLSRELKDASGSDGERASPQSCRASGPDPRRSRVLKASTGSPHRRVRRLLSDVQPMLRCARTLTTQWWSYWAHDDRCLQGPR